MANKNFDIKKEYTENKEGGKKKEHKKKYHKKDNRDREAPRKREEIVNEVDSDGFEIVGTKEKKKEQQREEYRKEYGHKKKTWKILKKDTTIFVQIIRLSHTILYM